MVAGLALFVGQRMIEAHDNSDDLVVRYVEYAPSLFLSEKQVKEWSSSLDSEGSKILNDENRIAATLVTIENFGEKPIVNQRVAIQSKYKDGFDKGVLGYQSDVSPGSDDRSTKAIVKDRTLFIDYDLIDAGEMHRFWVISDRYSDLNFVIRKPGMKVTGWDSKIYFKETPDDWTLFYTIGGIAAAIGVFAAGAMANNSATKKAIQANGLDFDDLVQQGLKKASQNKKKEETEP